MIVQPDFLDHWKTQSLIHSLSDPTAPQMVLRLWGHCQHRRTSHFHGLTASAIRNICRAYDHDAKVLFSALVEARFIEDHGDTIVVHGWAEANASLIANWENGKKGGRPKKSSEEINPSKTHGNPMGSPNQTDEIPIREDQTRSEETRPETVGAKVPTKLHSKRFERPSRTEFDQYVTEHLGMTKNDAEHVWNVWEENGWTRSQAGKPVRISKWRLVLSYWKTGNRFPSQNRTVVRLDGYRPASPHQRPPEQRTFDDTNL